MNYLSKQKSTEIGATAHGTSKTIRLCFSNAELQDSVGTILQQRGVDAKPTLLEDALLDDKTLLLMRLPSSPQDITQALPEIKAHGVEGTPPLILCPPCPIDGDDETWAASLASLRAHGAALFFDPDTWIEAAVLMSEHGLPPGPRVAIIAPPHTLLSASAASLLDDLNQHGPRIASGPSGHAESMDGLVDVVLHDTSVNPSSDIEAMIIPVVSRAELSQAGSLVGLKQAIVATRILGETSQRLNLSLGRDKEIQSEINQARLNRQLTNLSEKAGDHETKVVLSCFGIPVIRQAVATTPSAATRLAKKAGYPVQLKPWGPKQLTEQDGCHVERDLDSAADVRRAFATVCLAGDTDAAIVRATPPQGRECSLELKHMDELGWSIICRIDGVSNPLALVAPCHEVDAKRVAQFVVSSRQDDNEPDRDTFAKLLIQLSSVPGTIEALESLGLGRVIVGSGEGNVVVVDATMHLDHE